MEVIPAVDIKGGRCVQLYQGDYARETVYSDSPVRMASQWVEMGASRIHVIDLDGAKAGSPVNIEIAGEIARSAPVQLGGGIRTVEAANEAVSLGVSRVIIGTAAVEGQDFVQEVCRELGDEAVVVSVDARDGYVAVRGWTESSRVPAAELVKRIEDVGVPRFLYTDIARDGTLTEPNWSAIEELGGRTDLKMLVAGGISRVGHLVRLSKMGIEGAIVGTAIYNGDIDLREAIAALDGPGNNGERGMSKWQ